MPAKRTSRSCTDLMLLIVLGLVAGLLVTASGPAIGTTLVRCKIDGRTIYSDTDCPRNMRLKNDFPTSKPIRISRKSKSARRS